MKLIYRLLRHLGHQRWLRFGIRDRIIRFFIESDSAPSQPFTVPFFGYTYDGNLSSFIDWSTYFYGAYSYQELDLIRDILSKQAGSVFIDVGANVGNHSLCAAAHSNQVLSFEPVPALYNMIVHKQKQNKLTNLSVFNYALGRSDSTQAFLFSTSSNQGTGRIITAATLASSSTVVVKNGDAVLMEAGVTNITLIKIDVEGYEPYVLHGLVNALSVHRPIVFFEWTIASREHMAGQPARELFPENYHLYNFNSHRPAYLFFEYDRYQLEPASDDMPEGNYVAIPTEALADGRTSALRFGA